MIYSYAWRAILDPGKAVDFFQTSYSQPFEAHRPEFSRVNAWWLSEFSRLIYLNGGQRDNGEYQTTIRNRFLHKRDLEERWFHNGKHVQCAIFSTLTGIDNQFSVLVFRGTQGKLANWFINLYTTLSPWSSGGNVHRGFKMVLLEAWPEVEQQLNSLKGPVFYTGHSLGGALAVLAASLKAPEAVYTFGSPRIGDCDFINSTKQLQIYRVVNRRDIVTGTPPIPWVLHAGESHYLTHSKTSRSRRSWFEAPAFLADHSPSNYSVQI